jgi:hypothetical protein
MITTYVDLMSFVFCAIFGSFLYLTMIEFLDNK